MLSFGTWAGQDLSNARHATPTVISCVSKPRSLPQEFIEPQEIAVNLEVAKRIQFRFPLEILAGAKEIYETIEPIEDSHAE